MKQHESKDPLHGVTLEHILERLTGKFTWQQLFRMVPIQCFKNDPSIRSSLKFLRKTPWARKAVEDIYVDLKKRDMLPPEHSPWYKKKNRASDAPWLDRL